MKRAADDTEDQHVSRQDRQRQRQRQRQQKLSSTVATVLKATQPIPSTNQTLQLFKGSEPRSDILAQKEGNGRNDDQSEEIKQLLRILYSEVHLQAIHVNETLEDIQYRLLELESEVKTVSQEVRVTMDQGRPSLNSAFDNLFVEAGDAHVRRNENHDEEAEVDGIDEDDVVGPDEPRV